MERATLPPEDSRRPIRSDRAIADEFVFHLHRGVDLLESGRSLEAKEALEFALAKRPKDPESQALLALVYFRLGLYPRAIELYRGLIDGHPQTLSLQINLGVCYLKTGQHLRAEQILREVVDADPAHAKAWTYLGLAHERMGDFARAASAYELGGHPKQADRARALAEGRPDPVETHRVRDVASAFFEELAHERVEFQRAPPRPEERSEGTWTTLEPRRSSDTFRAVDVPPPSLRPTRPPPNFAESGPASTRAGAAPFAVTVHQGLAVWQSPQLRTPRLVRRECLFGYDGSLQPSIMTREISPGVLDSWCRFQGEGRILASARGKRSLLLLGPEPLPPQGAQPAKTLIARADLVVGHHEQPNDEREDLLWSDGVRLRVLRLTTDAEALLEVGEGWLSVPVCAAVPCAIRREVFVAATGALSVHVHDDDKLGQRGLIQVKGTGTLFVLRP